MFESRVTATGISNSCLYKLDLNESISSEPEFDNVCHAMCDCIEG